MTPDCFLRAKRAVRTALPDPTLVLGDWALGMNQARAAGGRHRAILDVWYGRVRSSDTYRSSSGAVVRWSAAAWHAYTDSITFIATVIGVDEDDGVRNDNGTSWGRR